MIGKIHNVYLHVHVSVSQAHIQWNLAIPATLETCKTGWMSEVAGSQRPSPINWPAKLAALVQWPHFRGLD